MTARPDFGGLRVLALESRRAADVGRLIEAFGGRPRIAPALRERPLDSNAPALDFAAGLLLGDFDIVVFLTGTGARALIDIVARAHPDGAALAALAGARLAARGPKPAAVLREYKLPIWVTAPEPNTWRELLGAMESRGDEQPLPGARLAVQEYGAAADQLAAALRARGAEITTVPVYRWALPDDLGPLRGAVAAVAGGAVDVLLLTSGVQLAHLWTVAQMMECERELRHGLSGTLVASIGPTTSEEIRRHGLAPDLEASRPRLATLVTEAASQARPLLSSKRAAARSRFSAAGAPCRALTELGRRRP